MHNQFQPYQKHKPQHQLLLQMQPKVHYSIESKAAIELHPEEEDQIQSILQSTQVSFHQIKHYTDSEINHLIHPKNTNSKQKSSLKNSVHSQLSESDQGSQAIASRQGSINNVFEPWESIGNNSMLDKLTNQRKKKTTSDESSSSQSPSGQQLDNDSDSSFQDNDLNLNNQNSYFPVSKQNNRHKTRKSKIRDVNRSFIAQYFTKKDHHQQAEKQPFQYSKKPLLLKNSPYNQIYTQLQQLQTPFTLQQVQSLYPAFMISKPTYKMEETVTMKTIPLTINNLQTIKETQLTVVDVNNKGKSNQRCIFIAGTKSNSVLLWEVDLMSPLEEKNSIAQIHQVFKPQPNQKILNVKLSPTMRYFSVSSNNRQFKVFQLQLDDYQHTNQPYYNKNASNKLPIFNPIQTFHLQSPKIKSNITECYFIEETPLKLLLVDEEYQIYIVEMKKQFLLSPKPVINKLPIKFNPFSQLKIKKITDENGQRGSLLIVGGESYVTFALMEPKFEMILVFDKEKHFPSAKPGGYPHILFVDLGDDQNTNTKKQFTTGKVSFQVLIAWDKHMQIIRFLVQDIQPFTFKIETVIKYSFPDSTILLGSLSETVIYQLTRVDLKIYSVSELLKYNSNLAVSGLMGSGSMIQDQQGENGHAGLSMQMTTVPTMKPRSSFAEPIVSRKIRFEDFVQQSGHYHSQQYQPQKSSTSTYQYQQQQTIQQLVSNPILTVEQLRRIRNFITTVSLAKNTIQTGQQQQQSHNNKFRQNTLMICFNQYLLTLSVKSFPQYIETLIDSINDWKVGLQLIHDAILKIITNYDNIKPNILKKQLREYSSRYIEFLKGVIPDCYQNGQIWRQEMSFLFNLLISCGEQKFLIKQIFIKLYRLAPQLVKTYEPFILLGKVTQIDVDTLDLLLSVVDNHIGKRLIYSIRNAGIVQSKPQFYCNKNSKDNGQLAHLINNILIRYEFYLQLIWVNQYFGDYYTPFVILMSIFEKCYNKKDIQIEREIEEKFIKTNHSQQQLHSQRQNISKNIMNEELSKHKQKKLKLTRLLGFLSFDTFRKINTADYQHSHNWSLNQEWQFHIPKYQALRLLQTLTPIMGMKLNKILIENSPQYYFDFIMEQLLSGNCVNLLLDSDVGKTISGQQNHIQRNWLGQIIQQIPFKIVVEEKQQFLYWLFIIRLMARKLSNGSSKKLPLQSLKIIPGLYYLLLQHQYTKDLNNLYSTSQKTVIKLIDVLVIQCQQPLSQQLINMDEDKKVQLFERIKQKKQQNIFQYQSCSLGLLRLIGDQLSREIEVLQCMIKESKQSANKFIDKNTTTVDIISYMNAILVKAKMDEKLSKNMQQSKKQKLIDKSLKKQQPSKPQKTPLPLLKSKSSVIKQILKNNIKLFTSIDPQKTSNFIIHHYKQQMKEFIFYLEENPKEQLNLLKQILIHYNYGQFLNHQKCKYLELLAITGQKQVLLSEIKSHMFPLDDAIEICKKYEILDAWAYLLVKSGGTGNSSLAIEIYFRLIKEHIQSYKYNRKTYQKWLQLKNAMHQELRKCIQVCIELDIQASNNNEDETEWFFIIQQLQQLRKFIYKTCSPEVQQCIKEIILQTLYPELIRQLLDQVPIQMILQYLRKSLNQIQPQTSQLIIQEMVKACQSQKMILKNAQQEISQFEIEQRKVVFTQTLKGFVTSSRCYECMKKDIQTKIHYFSCGHDIHPVCNQDVKECISCKFQQQTMISRLINQKDKVQKVIFYNPTDPSKQKTQSQIIRLSRQQKLKNYDDAMETYSFSIVLY